MENDLVVPQPPTTLTIPGAPAGLEPHDPLKTKWVLWFLAAAGLVGLAVAYPELRPLLLALAERMPR